MQENLIEKQIEQNQQQSKKQALILGATGAVGRELVSYLCQSDQWSKITVIIRRELPQWKDIQGKDKLDIIKKENLDCLQKAEDWEQFKGYDALFCCLGSRVKQGKEQFYKVDYTYCYWGALIAQKYNIKHFSLLSSQGAKANSSFLYLKTKGQIEKDIQQLQLPRLSILQPGFIKNRENDKRCGETFAKYFCCCFGGIEAKDLAKAIQLESEMPSNQNNQKFQIYSNSDLVRIAKQNI